MVILTQTPYFAGMKEAEAEILWVQGHSRLYSKTLNKGEREKRAGHGEGPRGRPVFYR